MAIQSLPETPFYFRSAEMRLFGVLHGAAFQNGHPVLFCHPFGEEKLWAHRVFVRFARDLAAAGHAVLRFDYRGNGDSEGEFAEWTIEGAMEDIAAAAQELQRASGATGYVLLGLRLGASLAAMSAERSNDVKGLIMWEPVIAGGPYAQELLRVNVTTQMSVYREVREDRGQLVDRMRTGQTVNVDGYEMTADLFDQLSGLDLAAAPSRFEGPTLIVGTDRGGTEQPSAAITRLSQQFSRASTAVVAEELFWKEIKKLYERAPMLASRTMEWMNRHGM